MSDTIYFCCTRKKVLKKNLTGRKTKTWILSNYYRHQVNHFEKPDMKKLFKKGKQLLKSIKN